MRDRKSTDERAKRFGIKIEKYWEENEPWGTPQVRADEENVWSNPYGGCAG